MVYVGQGLQRGDRPRPPGRAEPDAGHRRWAGRPADRARAEGPGRALSLGRHAAATRVCTTILDRATGTMTELVENGRPLRPEELDEFPPAYAEEAARAEVAVFIGSLPARHAPGVLPRAAARTPCPAVLDFRGEGLLGVLDLRPYVVKPNREELARTVGRPLDRTTRCWRAMRRAQPRRGRMGRGHPGARPVCVSSAEAGMAAAPSAGRAGGQPDRLRRRAGGHHRLGHPRRAAAVGRRAAGHGGGRAERPATVPLPLRPGRAGKGSVGGPRRDLRRITRADHEGRGTHDRGRVKIS